MPRKKHTPEQIITKLREAEVGMSTGSNNKADVLSESGVPGKGLATAPGLQKEFNLNSKAAERADKK